MIFAGLFLAASPSVHSQGNPFEEAQAEAGWKLTDWYGWVYDEAYPWIYTLDHGWQLFGEASSSGQWVYDRELRWIWMERDTYPAVFNLNRNVWLTHLSSSEDKRDFFDHTIREELSFQRIPITSVPWIHGFRLENLQVGRREVVAGTLWRDDIPAILNPLFVSPSEADVFMEEDDIVLSVTHGATTRAYPFRIMNWHEIVNDQIENLKLAATYCPLCGTAMVFDRVVNGRELTFGVSGLLYRDNVMMYDHQTESLWNQLALKAQSGIFFKTPLRWIPSQQMRYNRWKERYPDGEILSTKTENPQPYSWDPYTWVPTWDGTLYTVPVIRDELTQKAWVFGILINDRARAYPLEVLENHPFLEDIFEGVPLEVSFEAEVRQIRIVRTDTGEELPVVHSFWFAWQGFYPETTLFNPEE